jgi:CIC family chloride channel protein
MSIVVDLVYIHHVLFCSFVEDSMSFKKKKRYNLLVRFLRWRIRNVSNRNFFLAVAVLIGLLSGLAAVFMKNSVYQIRTFLTHGFSAEMHNYWFFVYPAVGIALVVLLVHYVLKVRIGLGIPVILHAISGTKGAIKPHHMFSSAITSTLTAGFGGSIGLEGPAVLTGGAIGSNLGQLLHLNYRQIILLIGCAVTGSLAALFKAPIASIIFTIEVLMLDLTLSSLVPLLLSSVSATLVSYFFLGQDVLLPIKITGVFHLKEVPLFILLGAFTGLVSLYFTKVIVGVDDLFKRIRSQWTRWFVAAGLLGVVIFLFPSLYGEGYDSINSALNGDLGFIFDKSGYYTISGDAGATILILALLVLMQVVATALTISAGGVGGIIAPSLFTGMAAGLLFGSVYNLFFDSHISLALFALVGMSGMIGGVLHAPLTGIFLMAEITLAYHLIVPLMITAGMSYITIRVFQPVSFYHIQLARRKQLFTQDKDKIVLSLMKVDKLIETNFSPIKLDATLGDLVSVIAASKRNIYPVVDDENNYYGAVNMDHVRDIMFRTELYQAVFIRNKMSKSPVTISPGESMEDVALKFHQSSDFNIPVLTNGKYVGFISRARLFSSYRQLLKKWSED